MVKLLVMRFAGEPGSTGTRHVSTQSASRGAIARLSLEHKLPMLMGGLLLLVIVALAAAAYLEVRRSAVSTASQRVASIALQLRDNFQQSGAQLRADIRT